MENEKIFELMEKMYIKLTSVETEMKEGFKKVDEKIERLENEVKATNAKIDGVIIPRLDSLYDGYKQNSEQIISVKEEVSKHEEVILKRVK